MVSRLDAAYDREIAKVREQTLAFIVRWWAAQPDYRDGTRRRLHNEVVPRIEAAQKRVAELTDGYLSRTAAEQLGAPISRGPVAPVTTVDLRGVPVEEVYTRPFTSVYTSLATGSTVTTAITAGATRLVDLAATGLQLAKTHSARSAMSRTGIELYQRTLTGRENCALCVIASTQRYRKANLQPIHPGCDCGVKPFVGDPDIQIINRELLESTHDAITAHLGGTDRGGRDLGFDNPISDFLDLIVTRQHGELGPVLTWRNNTFTSPGDLRLARS